MPTSSVRADRHAPSSTPPATSSSPVRSTGWRPTLQTAAELRLRYPSLSLRELAAAADPPVTKAAMAGRLARLVELARNEADTTRRAG